MGDLTEMDPPAVYTPVVGLFVFLGLLRVLSLVAAATVLTAELVGDVHQSRQFVLHAGQCCHDCHKFLELRRRIFQ